MSTIMRKANILSRCESIYRTDRLREANLCGFHHSYILAICHNPGLSQEQLARRVCFSKSNVTRHLAHLEGQGYVERRPSDSDKRVMLVYPTEKMLNILPEVRRIVEEWNAYLVEGLSPEEVEQFQSTLLKITLRAKEYVNSKDELEP